MPKEHNRKTNLDFISDLIFLNKKIFLIGAFKSKENIDLL